MYHFQQEKANTVAKEYEAHSKSVDQGIAAPIPMLSRGHGGVSTLWRKTHHQPTPLIDGTNRIVTIKEDNMVLVNVYMPCRGGYTNMEYQEALDQLHEICQKFEEHQLIVAGDFNVDTAKQSDVRVKHFKALLATNNLSEVKPITTPTFKHHNGKHCSRIDYIFINQRLKANMISAEYKVLELPEDTSSHDPILLKLELTEETSDLPGSQVKNKHISKPIWKKCNTELFEKRISEYLDTDVSPACPKLATDYLMKALQKVTKECVPHTNPKRRQKVWNAEIALLLKECKATHASWKASQEIDPTHIIEHLYLQRKLAKRKLRQAQRIQVALDRQKNLETLHQADENDKNLFYSIIKKQRASSSSTTTELILNNHVYVGDLLPAWEEHFAALATPSNDVNFTNERFERACMNIGNIRCIQQFVNTSIIDKIPITKIEVKSAITSLKRKKAKDGFGLMAEHLQVAPSTITDFLTPVLNTIVGSASIPEDLKTGISHPIHKKGKVKNIPGNHRGITISPVITKVLDTISYTHQKTAVRRDEDDLQYGFSNGRSGVHAAFIFNECIAESRDNKQPLYAASLDVQKAFDVLRHESLLDKLHDKGLTTTWWKLKDDSYRDLKTRVVWDGRLSNPIKMNQGNRQGAQSSPGDYVTYQDDNLGMLDGTHMGFHIGDTSFVSPTCADDMLILARSMFELQVLLLMVSTYANEEHYVIHPDKSVILPFNLPSEDQLQHVIETTPWQINNNNLPVIKEVVHVGVERTIHTIDPTVDSRISTGRKTLYALLGSGLHGTNGLPVNTSLHLYQIYVLPRVIYGLEALTLSKPNVNALELFQRATLKAILGVPPRTAIPALYIITGILPMARMIDQKHLIFLHSLICKEGRLKDLVRRQCIMKKSKSKSWVYQIKDTLRCYSLPCIPDLLVNVPSKTVWKTTVKKAVSKEAIKVIQDDAISMSTLQYLNPQPVLKQCHNVVKYICNPREVTRATIKTQMITGTYTLQASRYTFKQATSDTCLMCGEGPEDLTHLLLQCPSLSEVHNKYLPTIENSIPYVYYHRNTVIKNTKLFTHFIMDCTHPEITTYIHLPHGYQQTLETLSRNFCYAIHVSRSLKIVK